MKYAFLIAAYNELEISLSELKMLDHAKVDVLRLQIMFWQKLF